MNIFLQNTQASLTQSENTPSLPAGTFDDLPQDIEQLIALLFEAEQISVEARDAADKVFFQLSGNFRRRAGETGGIPEGATAEEIALWKEHERLEAVCVAPGERVRRIDLDIQRLAGQRSIMPDRSGAALALALAALYGSSWGCWQGFIKIQKALPSGNGREWRNI